jgi:thiamine-phosphate pyrophosphorylase
MNQITHASMRELLKVYFIMGSSNCEQDPQNVLSNAILGGVTLFQLREKGPQALTDTKRLDFARSLHSICKSYGVPFIVNDDVELALTLDADGVHIGQDDESAKAVRSQIGAKILGVSAHTVEEAKRAIADGADYLGIGPIFPTRSKDDAKEVQGTKLIRILREQRIDIPIVGIGGITPMNARSVIDDGADGVSVISTISMAESAREAARKLKQAVFGS